MLFGFLLAIRFTGQVKELGGVLEGVYYGCLVTTALALVLLLAPSNFHRIRFRDGDKEALLRKGNREAIAGSLALALTGAIFIITELLFAREAAIAAGAAFFAFAAWRWWAVALMRKAGDQDWTRTA